MTFDKVTIDLGAAFHRPAGNVVTVYEKGLSGGYGKDMQINVDEFSICLMKNRKPAMPQDYWKNVVDSCEFEITMYVTIPKSAGTITVPSTAAFQYDLGVQFIDYHAVWGMFEPSSDMSDENEIVIADEWGPWKDFQSAKLPFANPSVDMQITTQIAGALVLTGDSLYVKDENGKYVKNPEFIDVIFKLFYSGVSFSHYWMQRSRLCLLFIYSLIFPSILNSDVSDWFI